MTFLNEEARCDDDRFEILCQRDGTHISVQLKIWDDNITVHVVPKNHFLYIYWKL